MTGSQIIVLATPVFLVLIAIEWAVGRMRGRDTYRLNDALNSIGLGVLSQVVALFTKLTMLGIYTVVFERFALWRLPADALWVWAVALVGYDFCYYWLHRLGHTVALLWAAHVVHHQSEDYNLSTALRQTGSGWILGWLFYLPLAVSGVPPLVLLGVGLIDLLYQFWVHTQQIGKLGWFDRWFCSPSNHRVHHAVNDRYLDRNFGGILIIWDRLFGSFVEEDDADPCVFGSRAPLRSWDPIWANLQVYVDLARASWHASAWSDKLRVWLRRPGWRPAELMERGSVSAFDVSRVQRFDPPMAPQVRAVAALLFTALLALTSHLLWNEDEMSAPIKIGLSSAILFGLWLVGWLSMGGPRPLAQQNQADMQ